MSDGHGGYRRPAHPAPVSGPGALSKRTDGRQPVRELPGAKYGENAAFMQAQQSAPMSGDIGSSLSSGGPVAPDTSHLVPLNAPTQRPDEPIQAGMSGGPGAGPAVPNRPSTLTPEQADKIRAYLPVLITLASRDDADANTKQFVRQLRAELG